MSRRGTPPGSLGIADSLRALRDPAFYRRRATTLGPIFSMAQFHRPVAVVTDLALGLGVLRRERDWLTHPRPLFGARQVVDQVAFIANASHPRYRASFESAMAAPRAECYRDAVAAEVRRQLSAVAMESQSTARSPDEWLPSLGDRGLSTAMLGVGGDDERFEQVHDAIGSMIRLGRTRGVWIADHLAATVQLLRDVARSGRTSPPERSPLAALAHMAEGEVDDVALGNLALLLWATRSNVLGTLRWTLKELLDHPRCIAQLRDASAAGDDARVRALSRCFVQEVLRLHQSEFFQREVRREVRVDEFIVPRGWLFRVAVSEGHRDARVFDSPDEFRPDRFMGREYAPDEYVPFSDGSHSAYGNELALAFTECLVEVVAVEFDARVVSDGAPVRERMRHWSHWRPSRAWRVELSRR